MRGRGSFQNKVPFLQRSRWLVDNSFLALRLSINSSAINYSKLKRTLLSHCKTVIFPLKFPLAVSNCGLGWIIMF